MYDTILVKLSAAVLISGKEGGGGGGIDGGFQGTQRLHFSVSCLW